MKNNWINKLKEEGSCPKAIDWASDYKTPQAAWNDCERGDWMLWAWSRNCGKIGENSHRMLVLCNVAIAKTSVKYIKNKEVKKLVKKSLETTERWACGEEGVTLEDVEKAAAAAWSAGYVANTAAAWSAGYVANTAAGYAANTAAWSAGYAAVDNTAANYAADAAADAAVDNTAANYAADAAADAAVVANAAAYTAAKKKALKKCADIIRKIQPLCPRFKKVSVTV